MRQTIFILPLPLGTLSVVLHEGQVKNLYSLRCLQRSFLSLKNEEMRYLSFKYRVFSSLRLLKFLENAR